MTSGEPLIPPTRQQMRDAVQDVIQKITDDRAEAAAAVVRERGRKGAQRRRALGLAAFGIAAFAVALAISIPRMRHPFPAPTGAAAERDARAALLFAAGVVDGFRAAQGRLPVSLLETGVALPGVVYSPSPAADSYELSVVADGTPVTLRSSDDRAAFSRGGAP